MTNRNLHLTPDCLRHGTFEAGMLLGEFCREFCVPERESPNHPCPAFVELHEVEASKGSLAKVELREMPQIEKCAGITRLVDMTETPEERFFLSSYLDDVVNDERAWRQSLVERWRWNWGLVAERWKETSRRGRFDRLMWDTFRAPALIPQAWLNYLFAASDADQKILDEYPSRVDFVAFSKDEFHVVEVDGPSHYASYDSELHNYTVDENAYARNLRFARSLQRDGWNLTRLARVEIREVMEAELPVLEGYRMLAVLPWFYDDYPGRRPPPNSACLNSMNLATRTSQPNTDDDCPKRPRGIKHRTS